MLFTVVITSCKKYDMKEQTRPQKITVTTLAGSGSPGYIDGSVSSASIVHLILPFLLKEQCMLLMPSMAASGKYLQDSFSHLQVMEAGTLQTVAEVLPDFSPRVDWLLIKLVIYLRSMQLMHAFEKFRRWPTYQLMLALVKPGFSDGPITNAQFAQSFGLVIDDDGIIYLSDSKNRRVRRIAGEVSTLAGRVL
jgi:hypothetical protein